MIKYNRDQFIKDPLIHRVFMLIKANHKVANHTERVLLKNKHIKDFCEESRCFVELPTSDNQSIFLHYDCSTWLINGSCPVKIESIAFYDDSMEYTNARLRQLHGSKSADIPNIN